MKKPNGYWTFERCQEEALKYKTRKEFFKKSSGCYHRSIKNGWLNLVCNHMINGSVFWNKEICQEEALKYKTRNQFRLNSYAYAAALRNGWLDEICSHMTELKKPKGYWTFERCKKAAKECNSITEFSKKYGGARLSAYKNNWLNEICSDMIGPNRKSKKWTIYSYILLDKYVYVGLTSDEKSRKYYHSSCVKSAVYQFIINNNIKEDDIKYIIEIDNITDEKQSSSLEDYYLTLYTQKGYLKLNKIKTGGLGGMILEWTKDKCKEVAQTCKSRSEFSERFESAYSSSRKNKWLDEMCVHMKPVTKKPANYWTKELCFEAAKKYRTKSDFHRKDKGAFKSSLRNGWLDEICSSIIKK